MSESESVAESRHEPAIRLGSVRLFRPIVPRMWPQQIPCFRYVEVPESEADVQRSPVVPWEEFEAANRVRSGESDTIPFTCRTCGLMSRNVVESIRHDRCNPGHVSDSTPARPSVAKAVTTAEDAPRRESESDRMPGPSR